MTLRGVRVAARLAHDFFGAPYRRWCGIDQMIPDRAPHESYEWTFVIVPPHIQPPMPNAECDSELTRLYGVDVFQHCPYLCLLEIVVF